MAIQDPTFRTNSDDRPAILLVEPDEGRRRNLAGWLDSAGYRPLPTGQPERAFEMLRGEPAHLALVAGDSGPLPADLLDNLRRGQETGYLAIMVYGASLTDRQRTDALAWGADEVAAIDQPTEELDLRIRALLEQKGIRDELTRWRVIFRRSVARQQRLVKRVRRQNKRLREMAFTDPLTGVHNSRYFRQWLATQFEIARRYKLVMSVLMIDIDHFKQINDRCGHPFGDYVLSRFAEVLTQQIRSSDEVARLGGDEFAVGLVETGRQEAVRFGRRLLRAVAGSSFEYFGQAESITISIGQAGFPEDSELNSAEQLILFADQALYRAKANGRNDLACWHELDSTVRTRLASPHRQSQQMPTVSGKPTLCLIDEEP